MVTEFDLPYPPSVNHYFSYYQGRPVLSKDARTYRHQVRRIAITYCERISTPHGIHYYKKYFKIHLQSHNKFISSLFNFLPRITNESIYINVKITFLFLPSLT